LVLQFLLSLLHIHYFTSATTPTTFPLLLLSLFFFSNISRTIMRSGSEREWNLKLLPLLVLTLIIEYTSLLLQMMNVQLHQIVKFC
jgi:hypothetical protein